MHRQKIRDADKYKNIRRDENVTITGGAVAFGDVSASAFPNTATSQFSITPIVHGRMRKVRYEFGH
jgi:hypothetical protein